jgi:hypothetical protein
MAEETLELSKLESSEAFNKNKKYLFLIWLWNLGKP